MKNRTLRHLPKLFCIHPLHMLRSVGEKIGDLAISRCLKKRCPWLCRGDGDIPEEEES